MEHSKLTDDYDASMKLLSARIKLIIDDLLDRGERDAQVALSKIAKASPSVVNQWMSGEIKTIRIDYALNIEDELGYSHIWLMLGIGDRTAISLAGEALDEAIMLLSLYRQATPKGRKSILNSARAADKAPASLARVQSDKAK